MRCSDRMSSDYFCEKLCKCCWAYIAEWSQFYRQLPAYGGATFVQWGRKTSSNESTMIYTGIMAGPDTRSSASSNYQRLPSDPQYFPSNNPSKAYHSSLRPATYWVKYRPSLCSQSFCPLCSLRNQAKSGHSNDSSNDKVPNK